MNKKSILNPMKRIVTVMLAVAMVFSVNLTSMTAHAATALPTAQTELKKPIAIKSMTIGGNTVSYYRDDNDSSNVYIRYLYPNSTTMDTLKDVNVVINSSKDILWDGKSLTATDGVYSFNANLLNTSHLMIIGTNQYIVSAGIAGGNIDLTENPMAGYVSSVKLNETTADVTRTITEGACIGNLYYVENGIEWTSESLAISATGVAAPAASCTVAYTVSGGSEGSETVDLSTSSKKLTINGKTYTINASFVAQPSGFVATSSNFRIDFTELTDYKKANGELKSGYSWTTITKQMKEITDAQTAWYATKPTFKEGATCMDVLQDFLKFATTKGYFTCGTTDVKEDCTYVQYIDGLCPFTVASGMDGWMYTDKPDEAGVAPKNWYTAPIGAADYVLSSNTKIAWFFTTNYGDHPW